MFAAFVFVVFAVLAALSVLVHRRVVAALGLGARGRRMLAVVLASPLLGLLAGRPLVRLAPVAPIRALVVAAWTFELAIFIAGLALVAVTAARAVAGALHRRPSAPPREAASDPTAAAPVSLEGRLADPVSLEGRLADPVSLEVRLADPVSLEGRLADPVALEAAAPEPDAPSLPRRVFLERAATGSALLLGTSSSLYGALVGRHDYRIEEVVVPIAGLPTSLEGFTLVQLSDLHIGAFVGEAELAAGIDRVGLAKPDLVVLTGDLLDHDPRFAPLLGAFVRRLADKAPRGVVAVPGNHDYYAGIETVLATLRAAGAEPLVNGGRLVGDAGGRFALLGIDDPWGSASVRGAGPSLPRTLGSVGDAGRDAARVLLAHNPRLFEDTSTSVALQLSGHTHGGQVNLGVRPADMMLRHGWVAGLYERGASRIYVNRGFGTAGPPARIGAPPEITRVVLVAA